MSYDASALLVYEYWWKTLHQKRKIYHKLFNNDITCQIFDAFTLIIVEKELSMQYRLETFLGNVAIFIWFNVNIIVCFSFENTLTANFWKKKIIWSHSAFSYRHFRCVPKPRGEIAWYRFFNFCRFKSINVIEKHRNEFVNYTATITHQSWQSRSPVSRVWQQQQRSADERAGKLCGFIAFWLTTIHGKKRLFLHQFYVFLVFWK